MTETAVQHARDALAALVRDLAILGPFVELNRQWRTPARPADAAALEVAIADARAIRARIQDLFDAPRCAYDERGLALAHALLAVPVAERPALRPLVGETERPALVPYAVRATWLALEERSPERLLSGLVIHALVFPDWDDYRDVLIALAPARVCATEIGADAPSLFHEAATFAGEGVAPTFRSFGERETGLGAFGWRRVETPNGVRFHLGA